MAKQTIKRGKKGCLGLTGCLTRLLLIIVVETLTAAICFKVLGMNESSTYYTIFAMLCILSAFVLYYDNNDNEQSQKKKNQTEKKAGVGCLLVVALFFFVVACFLNTKNDKEDTPNRESTSLPFSSDTAEHKTKTNTGKFYQVETSKDDDELYDDPYDNPDFDDLFPGEEYDEEFIDSEGDPELYDEP